ncbi:AAA family ATPase [Laribacter hongkongensis]|uniref:DEAD/DEAH box helicase n=1 Tax=Laribacter hongkongensis TaxID=168471 RepID=UPI001EFCC373|nr:ATP-binding domain-containing protein [Laribacter hongkongensis]MCG8994569.1 AAA family ATPase [Laribacter hongkongensis]MCG9009222.1 AAA family ATPase [Laribacter hongkongensis]MCG9021837.1 AAA family ATPase [Laribacter hongkongensis]MCG9045566.1 AAA family ATPase [Laribacter hongkongensis]MCG9073029.1 AAA family ATPase [Laribacter hongkongensis]
MSNSFFFLQAEKNHLNQVFLDEVESFAISNREQIYVIAKPLGDSRYTYEHQNAIVMLSPKRKLAFIDFSGNDESFEEFVDDFVEDLASISDKYRYKEAIGRPRSWKSDLITKVYATEAAPFSAWHQESTLHDPAKQRIAELLVSLLTGSINDIERVQADLPTSLLDKVKRKIQLFDGDQTRFIYEKPKNDIVRIQGLSGTGKTELLLHKLRDLYVNQPNSKILFTCHNKILAEHLRRRIPDFFNFMKVEEQIAWETRLWCIHGWGSNSTPNSGTYRLICNLYKLQFKPYSAYMSFDRACREALDALGDKVEPYFDHILIDESQDFPESFIALCRKVTRNTLYVAGDIFQSIFDANITPSIAPDHLLSKCYRTDPRTLMFAHAIGMGLFEDTKLRWLEDPEWDACGYNVEKAASNSLYRLTREPLRRFEDIDNDVPSVVLEAVSGNFMNAAATSIVAEIRRLAQEHPSLQPDDIGIIILDRNDAAFPLADKLSILVRRELGWSVNKAHETKRREPGQLFVSNKNNVKGLEFPFVICVSEKISNGYVYRNSLYMTLTRSFLQSLLIVSEDLNRSVLPNISDGLSRINTEGKIEVMPPNDEEKARIKTTITVAASTLSFFDMAESVFDELNVPPLWREPLLDALKKVIGEEPDIDNIRETTRFMYEKKIQSGA